MNVREEVRAPEELRSPRARGHWTDQMGQTATQKVRGTG
jgi:hypothetical protein